MRLVVKLGTSSLTNGSVRLNRQRMLEIVQQIAALHQQGHEVVVVSSGAQAAGRERLGFPALDKSLPAKQMLSAVGQGQLMHIYSGLFDIFEIAVGQVLLTRSDLNHRTRYLNARDTLITLIEQRIVPIINENDTTATDEIRVGDNDNLSAMVANVIEADLLIILTDQQGVYTGDPRHDPQAQLIPRLERIDDATMQALAGGAGSVVGTGGMTTKLQAAQFASRSGIITVIAGARAPDVIQRIVAGEALGTRVDPLADHLESRKRWLLTEKPRGVVRVDAGAARVLRSGGASLLAVGMTAVEGEFRRGESLLIAGPDDVAIAHGISNYDSDDLRRLCGVHSQRVSEILGYSYGDAVIHRNNMVLLA